MARGGFRPGSGRKKMAMHLRRLPRVIYLTDEENKIVRKFVCEMRLEKQSSKAGF